MKLFYSVLILGTVMLSSAGRVCAQSYYPGGLGNSNLIFWLNANNASNLTVNGSNQVSKWTDLSGNGYNFSQGTTGNKPVYSSTGSAVGKPAVTFNANNSQYLSTPTLPSSISWTSGVSSLSVASFTAPLTSWGWQRIYDLGDGQAKNNINFGRDGATANLYAESWNNTTGDQTYTSSSPISNHTESLFEMVQSGGTVGNTSQLNFYMGGTAQASTGAAGSSVTWVPPAVNRTSNLLGASNWNADEYFGGTISEIMLYNESLDTTQRIILENYLHAEWNLTVAVKKYTPPTSTTYGTNLVGIGYTSSSDNFLADVAGSTDGLGFSSGSGATDFLNTAGYIMAAHNGQAATVLNNVTLTGITSSSSISRWNRSWNLQSVGGNSSGLVTVTFNFSDYNSTTPNSAYSYGLLYNSTDGTYASGTNKLISPVSYTVSGNTVSFVVKVSSLVSGYYTLMYSASILPVVISSFSAAREQQDCLLSWTTAQEVNSSYFEVQHSTNGSSYSAIGTVTAKGNSSLPSQYSFTDNLPAAGVNYYRLKMVDLDGNAAWSEVRSVDFGSSGTNLSFSLYPNPVADELHVRVADAADLLTVQVFSMQGQVVRAISSGATSDAVVSMNGLPKGAYTIVVNADGTRYTRVIMKN
jgi:hypothetical protein